MLEKVGTRTRESARTVDAVLRALDVLECLQDTPSLGVGELARRTGLTRSRVMRLAGTLESRGYLGWEPRTRRYRLGPRLSALGRAGERDNDLVRTARPVLQQLVEQTGESASLYAQSGTDRVVVAQEQGTREVRYSAPEGRRDALHAGAAGKVLLAYADSEIRDALLSQGPLTRITGNTIVDPQRLRDALGMIRRLNYGESDSERVSDVWSVAAPVFDVDGTVVAALGLAGPISRFNDRHRQACREAVMAAAKNLSADLGWRPTDQIRERESHGGRSTAGAWG